ERGGDLGVHAGIRARRGRRPGASCRGALMTAVALDTPVAATPAAGGSLSWLRERGMGASILVSAISTAFGVLLISATAYIGAMLRANPYIGDSGTLGFVLSFLTLLLVGVAVYVASIVTANTFSTIVAGRTRR